MSTGKAIRMNQIMAADGRSLIVALDHGIAGVSPLGSLREPVSIVSQVVEAGADAIITTPGIAGLCAPCLGRAGLILRIDAGPTALTGNWNEMQVALEIDEALRLGAAAVIMMGIAGAEGESQSLANLARVAARCSQWGVPLVAEMLPGGFAAGEVTIEQIAIAARLGAELGADLIKIRYQGPSDAFRTVIESCYRPVVILGGSKQSPEALEAEMQQALQCGAAGAAIGRNIWQHPNPAAMTRRLRETIHS